MDHGIKGRRVVTAKNAGKTVEAIAKKWEALIPAGRFGDPAAFGELCTHLCSSQAALITGQNLLFDGGAYPGTGRANLR